MSVQVKSTNEKSIKARIDEIRKLATEQSSIHKIYQAVSIALSVVNDTVGVNHPIVRSLEGSLTTGDWGRPFGACQAVISMYENEALTNPRLKIAAEIETDILVTSQQQVQAAETAKSNDARTIHLAIAAFLAGSALEDALRRLCDANGFAYDSNTSISKLQNVLYRPSDQVEIISRSDTKQIIAWGDTRNKADHGKFHELTQAEVHAMVIGVQSFVDRHLSD